MTGLEPPISGAGSYPSTHCATTTDILRWSLHSLFPLSIIKNQKYRYFTYSDIYDRGLCLKDL